MCALDRSPRSLDAVMPPPTMTRTEVRTSIMARNAALRHKLEEVWTHRWSGVFLTVAPAAMGVYLFVRVPVPGVSVAVMG
jgi:hypothetical protein